MNSFVPRILSTFLLSGVLLLGSAGLTTAEETGSAFASETIDPGLVVSDVKKAVEFYTQAIGFKEVKGFSVPGDWTRTVGLTDGKTLDIRVLVLGEGKNATKLKLMQLPGADIKKADNQYVPSQLGIRYLAIQVTDIDEAVARLAKAGAKSETKGGMVELPEGLPQGIYIALVRDPDGNMIELVGPKKKQKQ
ncbi:MAG: bleomycin resistance protein [Verrucomicrobiaceae bacterium]|nr:MAG: bleomycin resistance protein [Verrucomicrobiaceae bacterium]